MRSVAVVVSGVLLAACGDARHSEDFQGLPSCDTPVAGTQVAARQIGRVQSAALLVTAPPSDPRLFVVEQRGAIRIFNSEQLLATPFLDLTPEANGPVLAGGEQGLLGLAFHPKYATNGTFFVFYTTRRTGPLRDVLARCQVTSDPDRADPKSCVEVLAIPDFAANHNGGMIEFGSDGFLYVATGDGGGGGDPERNGQNSSALLGKMLRLDVDGRGAGEYGIPADNPFAAGGGAPEVFMLGIRNAWRWTFDRMTHDMWIADVGQDTIEELTVLRPADQKGANLGWSMYEGNNCFRQPCARDGMVFPQHTRTHSDGYISITGGQVYRGTCYPDIVGWYFFTDYGKGGLAKAQLREDGSLDVADLPGSFPGDGASLHEDARGELYLTNTGGYVYHLEAGP